MQWCSRLVPQLQRCDAAAMLPAVKLLPSILCRWCPPHLTTGTPTAPGKPTLTSQLEDSDTSTPKRLRVVFATPGSADDNAG